MNLGVFHGEVIHIPNPCVLRPFHRSETCSIVQASVLANRTTRTIRSWCLCYQIGRRIPAGGPWQVSRVALAMLLDGDRDALTAYLRGDRTSACVTAYYDRLAIPVPHKNGGAA